MNEKDLLLSEERLKMVLEGSDLGFWDWNIETGEVKRNDRWAQMLGYSTIKNFEDNTDTWTNSIHPDDRDAAWKSINDHLEGRTSSHKLEYRMLTKEGTYKWILDHAKIVQRDANGRPLRMSGTHLDITERKNMEEKLKHMAAHDPLTGLYNRNALEQRLNNEIERASRYKHALSVFMLDLDYFKSINDTYGHLIGDTVLNNFATFLANSIRNSDYAARYGGEEFVVILPETRLPEAQELAERLRKQLDEYQFSIEDNKEFNLTISVGIATFPEHAKTWKEILEAADSAMYAAKEAGRNMVKVTSRIPALST